MKKRYPIGIAALMLAIGLVLLGCSDDNSSSGPGTKTYSGEDGDTTYELKITGDDYVLTITDSEGTKKTNSGTVISDSSGTIGLQPEAGKTIVITTESGGIGGIEVGDGGSISVKDEDGNPAAPVAPPAEITPVTPPAVGGNSAPKTLVITGITSAQASQGQSGINIGIFQRGTTPEQAMSMIGYVAGAESEDVTLSGSTLTVSLWTPSGSGYTEWTGSGNYDIYLILGSIYSGSAYRRQNVSFTSASTTVTATSFSPLN
ncbi:MAG: hypothetical protein LBK05_07890 [Treponema sp.]|jgi:hypothetical protein|nr:hypothetical protein [Treponema sp.]